MGACAGYAIGAWIELSACLEHQCRTDDTLLPRHRWPGAGGWTGYDVIIARWGRVRLRVWWSYRLRNRVHCTLYTVQCTPYTVHCTNPVTKRRSIDVHCSYNYNDVRRTMYTVQCAPYIILLLCNILWLQRYSVTLCVHVHYTLYSVHYTLYTVYRTL